MVMNPVAVVQRENARLQGEKRTFARRGEEPA